jgi:glucose-1-phosphate thymidylyltransferase
MRLKGVVVASRIQGCCHSLSDETAGATARIANRPVVAHVIDAIHGAGAQEVAVVGDPGVLEEIHACLAADGAPPGVVYLPAPEPAGVVDLLTAATGFVDDAPCVVHAANGVLEQPVSRLGEIGRNDPPDLAVFVHHGSAGDRRFSGEVERLLGVSDLHRGRSGLGLAGVWFFGPGALRYAAEIEPVARAEADVTAIAEVIAGRGGRLEIGRVKGWRQYNGHPHDLLEMNRIVLDELEGMIEHVDGPDNQIEGRVQIAASAHISGSVISGPVVIGEHALITDAYIGPYTSIGAGAEISGSEVERSIVGDRARIRHVGVRVQGSTVGPEAIIFRDFGLPRALRMHVGAGIELALE